MFEISDQWIGRSLLLWRQFNKWQLAKYYNYHYYHYCYYYHFPQAPGTQSALCQFNRVPYLRI